MMVLHLCAKHTKSGVPCRCFVVLNEKGAIVDVIDDAAEGEQVWTELYPKARRGPTITTTNAEYRALLRLRKALALGVEYDGGRFLAPRERRWQGPTP